MPMFDFPRGELPLKTPESEITLPFALACIKAKRKLLAKRDEIIRQQREEIKRLKADNEGLNKCLDVAMIRYDQLRKIHRDARSNEEIAQLVRECVTQWNDVEAAKECPACPTPEPQVTITTEPQGHCGDCTIYGSMENERPYAGICTCGYGLSMMRQTGKDNELFALWVKETMERKE